MVGKSGSGRWEGREMVVAVAAGRGKWQQAEAQGLRQFPRGPLWGSRSAGHWLAGALKLGWAVPAGKGAIGPLPALALGY